jgi:lipopolysaccharide/colanic/teichoic acid biosynthesis glycosyltransferase
MRRVLKHALDRAAAAVALLLLSPLLGVLVVLIRRDSPGGALFRQPRVGLGGGVFTCLKFRTMCDDAERQVVDLVDRNETGGTLFKIRSDPRITRIGGVLRRYSLDELPQLINVLRGEMSLVGPRPPLQREVDAYQVDVRRRLLVRPGMTGLWQVSGRSDLTWEEAVRLDLYYVENWSPLLDLTILWRTLNAVWTGHGAY